MTKSGNLHLLTGMKSLILVSLLGSIVATVGQADPTVMRESATNQQVSARYLEASQEDPMRKQTPVKSSDTTVAAPPTSLLNESDVICWNDTVALVPKRAILQVPKNYADRLKYKMGAKLMSWGDFYAVNRGWITAIEVTRVQAEGSSPLPEQTTRQMTKSGNLIIATYQSSPISVLPLKVAAPVETKSPTPKP